MDKSIEKLKKEIEREKLKLNSLVIKKGLLHIETQKQSEIVDELLVQLMRKQKR